MARQAFRTGGSGTTDGLFAASYSCGARTLLSSDVSSYLVNQQWFRHEGFNPLPAGCTALAFLFFPVPPSSLFSFGVSPAPSFFLSRFPVRRQLFTLRRRALRANGRISSRGKMDSRLLDGSSSAPLSFHSRRRCPSFTSAVRRTPLRVIRRIARDVRNVGYFPVRRDVPFFVSLSSLEEREELFSYA